MSPREINTDIAQRLRQRIDKLAEITDEPEHLTRWFLSDGMVRANSQMEQWCQQAGMTTTIDAAGNLRARYAFSPKNRKILAIGSHLDTVRNAGKYDGPLGVLMGLACVEQCIAWDLPLPFDIEVIAFSDEEGLRYQTAYLGSAYYAGQFKAKWLELVDRDGITLKDALEDWGSPTDRLLAEQKAPENLCAYLETHIEQGPVLEKENCATGIVTTIAAQFRIHISVYGKAGHAGTTPMEHRQDALCTAVELISLIEETARTDGELRATIGQIRVEPDVSNVIPDACFLTLDIRHPQTSALEDLTEYLHACALTIAATRRTNLRWNYLQRSNAVDMSPDIQSALSTSALAIQGKAPSLPSGAGHDAVIMASIAPSAMLFVRCREGLSHHPDEHVQSDDIDVALKVMSNAIAEYAESYQDTD